MVLGTIVFFVGFILGVFTVAVLSVNHGTANDYTELLEAALNDERLKHNDEYHRVRKYHLLVVGERDATISKLRERNRLLELQLVNATGRTADGTPVEAEVAHV